MNPPTRFPFAVATSLLLTACAREPAPAAPNPAETRAATEVNVRAQVEEFKKAIGRRDTDAILTFYTPDGWQLPQNGPIARTAEERRALWKAMESLPITRDAVDVADRIDVSDSGDLAVQYGEFRQIWTDRKGGYKSMPQKFITVWRRQPDGEWKVSASMASVEN